MTDNDSTGRWARLRPYLLYALIAAASVAVLVLRLRQAPAPMTADEYASMYFSGRSMGDLWGWWMLRETNPPLFYSLLKIWRMVVPESEAALRLLPLLLSLAQIGLIVRIAGKTYGGVAAVLCLVLFALSPSDIFQSEYLRGYVLAKLGVTVSFVGLLLALEQGERRTWGWAAYVAGAVVAIYSHTTLLLWPPIASVAVLADRALSPRPTRVKLSGLVVANIAVALLSSWVLWFAIVQLRTRAANISWITPLSLDDYASSVNLQLLLDGTGSSALMGILMVVGLLRTARNRVTRLSAFIVAGTLITFKAVDVIHPIMSDYTMHWCASFTILLASAALADPRWPQKLWLRIASGVSAALVLIAVSADGLYELIDDVWIPEPQDFNYAIETVAHTPNSALLVSHESVGLVVTQACMLEFHRPSCPFRMIVMQNPAQSDSWAFGGYPGPIIPARYVRKALGGVQTVYVFSRYVYTPLAQLGMPDGKYRVTAWDDGELIGPIKANAFRGRY